MDHDEPRTKQAVTLGEDLSTLSLEELAERREMLLAEIERVDRESEAKQSTRAGAEALFGKG